eukprot:scaffold182778_cov35-Tisochrysis_lutea.AAC.1
MDVPPCPREAPHPPPPLSASLEWPSVELHALGRRSPFRVLVFPAPQQREVRAACALEPAPAGGLPRSCAPIRAPQRAAVGGLTNTSGRHEP